MLKRSLWKTGLVLGMAGIPAPSGRYGVGCVDLMHQIPGDMKGGLLVRLFYPSYSVEEGGATGFQYAKWLPHERYVKAYTEMATLPGGYLSGRKSNVDTNDSQAMSKLFSMITTTVMAARSPALYGAPIIPKATLVSASRTTAAPPTSLALLPVIVFSHGLAAMRTTYTGICCDLASHGYIVASVEHRDHSAFTSHRRVPKMGSDRSNPQYQDDWLDLTLTGLTEATFHFRHSQVCQRADDVRKSLDLLQLLNDGAEICNMMEGYFDFRQFQGRMNIATAAVIGHSFGGATTIQTLSEDSRFRCGIALDCWMLPIHRDLCASGVQQPLLFINSKHHVLYRVKNLESMMKMEKPPDETGFSKCQILTLKGTHHFNQTDLPFVLPDWVWAKFCSELEPVVAHTINQEICHHFLKRYLLQADKLRTTFIVGFKQYVSVPLICVTDPAYRKPVPNLDGTEGHSEHIHFGADLNGFESRRSHSKL